MTAEYARMEWDRAVEAAVHRDLVKPGRWPTEIGRDYSFCAEARGVGDYGTDVRMDAGRATEALEASGRILRAVHSALPADFPSVPDSARLT